MAKLLYIADISKWQGNINFEQLKGQIDGLIIRIGYTGTADKKAHEDEKVRINVEGAEKAGIPYSFYYYSESNLPLTGNRAANFSINTFRDIQKDLGKTPHFTEIFFLDIENLKTLGIRSDGGALPEFEKVMKEKGFISGIYSNQSTFMTSLGDTPHSIRWVAKWSSIEPDIDYDIWQYTNCRYFRGIEGRVDCSKTYNTALIGNYEGEVEKLQDTIETVIDVLNERTKKLSRLLREDYKWQE
ncbi:GH25 muramidase [Capybara microvirus Cap3_SP_389]|nr:GH25 muramidase [Capybara microvirus Cap3_SP_389]